MLREKVDFINEMAQNIFKLNAYIFLGEWRNGRPACRQAGAMKICITFMF